MLGRKSKASLLTLSLLAFLHCLVPVSADKHDRNRGRILLAGLVIAGETSGQPLDGALVEIIGTEWSSKTDKNGQFIFTKAPFGEVTVKISKEGYQTVTRSVEIERDNLMPPNLAVQLLPESMSQNGRTLTGKGVLYVAYAKPARQSTLPDRPRWNDLDKRGEWLFSDPLENAITDPSVPDEDPVKRATNPVSMAAHYFMLYPPTAPEKSSFHGLASAPYYLAFGPGGQHLFVAGTGQEILVYDEDDRHEKAGIIPLAPNSRVTDLTLSDDGRYILASVMGSASGVLAIDSQTVESKAFLPIESVAQAVPTSVCNAQDGSLLVTFGNQSDAGKLLHLDPHSGEVLQTFGVGTAPVHAVPLPGTSLVYVVNSRSGSLSLVDLKAGKTVGFLNVGVSPQHAVLTPDGKQLLVANRGSDAVAVVDAEQHKLKGFVRVGSGPSSLALSEDGRYCYVGNRDGRNVSVLDLEKKRLVHNTDPMPNSEPFDLLVR